MSFHCSRQIQTPRSSAAPTAVMKNSDAIPAVYSANWRGFSVNVSSDHLLSQHIITEAPSRVQVYDHVFSNQTLSFTPPAPYFQHNNQACETLRHLYKSVPLPQSPPYVTQPPSVSLAPYPHAEPAYHPVEINGTTYYFSHDPTAVTNFIPPDVLGGHSGAPAYFNNVSGIEKAYDNYIPIPTGTMMSAVAMNQPLHSSYLLDPQNQQKDLLLPLPQDTTSLNVPKEKTPYLLPTSDGSSINFNIHDVMSLQPVIMEKLEKLYSTQFLNLLYLNIPRSELKRIEESAMIKIRQEGKNRGRDRFNIFKKPTNENELYQRYEELWGIIFKVKPILYEQRIKLIERLAFGLKNTHTSKKMDYPAMLNLISMFFCPYQKAKYIPLNLPYLASASTLYATTYFDTNKNIDQHGIDCDEMQSPVFIHICNAMQIFQQSFYIKMENIQSQVAEARSSSEENTNNESLRQYFYCFCDFALKCTLILESEKLENTSLHHLSAMSFFLKFIVQLSEYQQDYKDDFIYIIHVQLAILNFHRTLQIVHSINEVIQTNINEHDAKPIIKILVNFVLPLWKSLSITLEYSLSCQRLDIAFSHFEIIRKGYFLSIENIEKILSEDQKILLQDTKQCIAHCCCIVLLQLRKVLSDNSQSYSEGLDPFVKRLENDILPIFEHINFQLITDSNTTIEKEDCQIYIMQNTLEQIKADILAIDPRLKVSNTLIDDLLKTIQSTVENIEQKEKEKHHSLGTSKKCRTLLKQSLIAPTVEWDTNTNIQVANTEITEVFSVENKLSQLIRRAEDIIQSSEMKEALELEDLNAIHEHCSDITEHQDFLCWVFGELAFQTYFAQRKEFVRALKYIEQCKELYVLCTKLSDAYDSSNTSLNSVTWFKENNPSGSLKEKNIISLFSISTQSEIQQLNKKLVLINLLYVKSMECIEEARQYLLKNINSPTCSSQELEFMTARLERFISHLEFLEKNALEIEQYRVLMKPYIDFNALIKRRKAFFKKLGLYGNNPNRQTERKSKSGLYELVEASEQAANVSGQTIIVNFSAHSKAFRSARENLQQFLDKDKSNPLSDSQENVSDIGNATASYVPSVIGSDV